MRLQGSLGHVDYSTRQDLENKGKASVAKVIKVYNENNTADVMLMTNNYLGDNDETEGKITAAQIQSFAGWDDVLKVAYGEVTPLHVGQLVLVSYFDSMKGNAIITGSIPPHINEFNNSPRFRSEKADFPKERHEKITVTRNQDYSYINGDGEFEKVSSSRAFFVGKKEKMSDDRKTEFNYENLTLKNKLTKKTIGLLLEQLRGFKPFNFLGVTKSQFKDKGATFNRFYHDAEKGITRFTKDSPEKVWYIQLDEDNNFEIRTHLDTNKRDIKAPKTGDETLRESDIDIWDSPKENTIGEESKEYSRIKMDDEGAVFITQVKNDGKNKSEISIDKEGKISISQENKGESCSYNMDGGKLTISATETIRLDTPSMTTPTGGE
ncbi:MAG: hypothetical protein GXZ11_01330 [Tissierellia bacterium]|nr:hypothetical protein [Tissierellia bacterium]